jgi:hypothetical protein
MMHLGGCCESRLGSQTVFPRRDFSASRELHQNSMKGVNKR